ncbi:MAG: universal stress protein [Acidimicrobiia bacterium]
MRIVVGVEDGSPSMAALRRARAIAEDLEADLHVVFVAHVPATVLAA